MKRLLAAMTAAILMVGLFASTAMANPNTFKSGPYASGSADSGTCGNPWANDTYNTTFTVDLTTNTGGTYNVVEKYQGRFVTLDGRSPGGCETTDTNHGTSIVAGVSGKLSGTVTMVVTGTFDPTASCADPCTRSTWVANFFGSGATWTEPGWSFQYNAPAKGLLYNQWTNAITGNLGDIASS
jgi:hypothetical protein